MSRAPSTFRESDIKRAVRALEAAGKKVTSVEIEGGLTKIKVKNGDATDDDNNNDTSEWDKKYGQH